MIMPSSLLTGPRRSCRPEPGAAIPRGLQLSTGKLVLPARRTAYGTACMLVCPHCHAYGRGEEAAIVHVPRGRRYKDGTYANNYFKHLSAPDDPVLPCYRKNYSSESHSGAGGGGPETLVHYLGAEFIGWWLDTQDGWVWEDARSGARYPDSDYRFDAVLTNGGQNLAIEAEVTHRIDRKKVAYLKTLDWAVIVADMSHPEVREWLHPRLAEWDRVTDAGEADPMPLAQEIYNYMERNSVFQPLENDYYVRNNNA